MRFLVVVILIVWNLPAIAQQSNLDEKIMAAMAGDIRTEAEIARDKNRKPIDTLNFFQLKDDMRVLELIPGGGWYTKILAPTLRENGELYVAIINMNWLGYTQEKLTSWLYRMISDQDGFDRVKVLQINAGREQTGNISAFDFGVENIDLAVTFRNMHNFTPEGRGNINAAVFDSLKSGGLFGIVDHSKRHMEPMNNENRRRVDPVQIIHEVLAVGFEFVDFSDLHYRPDDELRFEVGRKTVTGNTDRFTLLFRKP